MSVIAVGLWNSLKTSGVTDVRVSVDNGVEEHLDGYVVVAVGTRSQWEQAANAAGTEGLCPWHR